MAEGLLAHALRSAVKPTTVSSAGSRAQPGMRMDPHAQAQLLRREAHVPGFRARRLTADMIEDADLILTASRDHREDVVTLVPTSLRRCFTVRECARLLGFAGAPPGPCSPTELAATAAELRGYGAGRDAEDIADPVGQGRRAFARTADELAAALAPVARWLGASP